MPDLLEPLRSHWPFQRAVSRDLDQMMRRLFDGKPTRGEWVPTSTWWRTRTATSSAPSSPA